MMNRKIISEACTEKSPLNVWLSTNCIPGSRQLGAHEHRHKAGGDEEEDRRDDVLDADHLVVGVDPEVVAPAPAPWPEWSSGRVGRPEIQ